MKLRAKRVPNTWRFVCRHFLRKQCTGTDNILRGLDSALEQASSSSLHSRLAQYFQSSQRGRIAVLGPDLFEDPRGVDFDGVFGTTENSSYLAVRFALS